MSEDDEEIIENYKTEIAECEEAKAELLEELAEMKEEFEQQEEDDDGHSFLDNYSISIKFPDID